MVYFLIDNYFIDNSLKNNKGFFFSKCLVPININYSLDKFPYYQNSRYYYRDLKDILKNDIQKTAKPYSKSNRISDIYYNPKKNKGKIIKYEYIPRYIPKYNNTPLNTYIEKIEIYSNIHRSEKILKNIYLLDKYMNKIKSIEFVLLDINKTYIGYKYIWIAKNKCKLDEKIYFLGINEFIAEIKNLDWKKSKFLLNIALEYI